jgi:hypothetical protein
VPSLQPLVLPPAPAAPAAPAAESQSSAADDEEFESTIVVVRGTAATRWKLIDTDGSAFELHRVNLLGRKPAVNQAPEGAQIIALSDPERVLSRTHAVIEVEDDRVWITDLDSTNGSEVLGENGTADECAPRTRYALAPGQRVSLGGREVSFESPDGARPDARG